MVMREIYQDSNNNDHVDKVAIIGQYMSLDGGIIDDSDPDETGMVHVQQKPIEGELLGVSSAPNKTTKIGLSNLIYIYIEDFGKCVKRHVEHEHDFLPNCS